MSSEILAIIKNDPWLEPYKDIIYRRYQRALEKEKELTRGCNSLSEFANGHL